MGTMFPEDGGYVVWVSSNLGPYWGFQQGWMEWLSGSSITRYTHYFNYWMALLSGSVTTFTGISYPNPLLPIRKFTVNTSINDQKRHLVYEKIFKTIPHYFVQGRYGARYAISVGRKNHELSLHNNDVKEPFWLAPTKGFVRGLKFVFSFLAEQPSQLKYIEWPGFQNTLKTAALTLVLVAMLIVVLSSVDSGLWYLLTLILRKPA